MKKLRFAILHEDDHLIAINKPAPYLTIPDRYDDQKPNLKATLLKAREEIYVVHRLDEETSGVILFAKTEEAHKSLCQAFESRLVTKKYLAICKAPATESGTIENRLAADERRKGLYVVAAKGKPALTTYKMAEKIGPYALMALEIYTGRTHQIRVHMKHIQAPLICDSKYGLSDAFYLSQIKKIRYRRDEEERPLLGRSSLHSALLELTHPITGKKISFEAPLPKDMKATLHQLKRVYS